MKSPNMSQKVEAVTPVQLTELQKYILQTNNVPLPQQVQNISPIASDLSKPSIVTISDNETIARAIQLFELYKVRLLPVVDKIGSFKGILMYSDVVRSIYGSKNVVRTSWNKVRTLLGDTDIPEQQYYNENRIFTLYTISCGFQQFKEQVNKESITFEQKIFITSDINIAKYLDQKQAFCIYTQNQFPKQQVEMLESLQQQIDFCQFDVTENNDLSERVIFSTQTITEINNQLKMAIPVANCINPDSQQFYVTEQTQLEDVAKKIGSYKDCQGLAVVNNQGIVKNVITRHDLANDDIIDVTLVGTQSLNSIPGIKANGVRIKGIIDCKSLQHIETAQPIQITTKNCACTCSIIACLFTQLQVVPPINIANVMYAGIIVGTQIFKSPYCSDEDYYAAQFLSKIVNKNVREYGRQLLSQITLPQNLEQHIYRQEKIFSYTIGEINIFSIETCKMDMSDQWFNELEEVTKKIQQKKHYIFSLGLILDIINRESYLLVIGQNESLTNQFVKLYNQQLDDQQKIKKHFENKQNIVSAYGLVSRELQLKKVIDKIVGLLILE